MVKVSLAPSRPTESDPAAVAIVERGIAAIGGRERLAAVTGFSRRGVVRTQGLEGYFGEWFAPPFRRRAELYYSQASWVTVVDGERVERRVLGAPAEMDRVDRAEWTLRSSPWPELRAKELNLIFELAGEETIQGAPALGVRGYYYYGTLPNEFVTWIDYYDCETGRLARRVEGEGAGKRTTTFHEYAETGGVFTPRRVRRTFGKRATDFMFKEVDLNNYSRSELYDAALRRTDEPLVVAATPEKLHREPLDPAMRFDQITFRVSFPNAVLAAETKIQIKLQDGERVVETREFPGTAARREDATEVPRLPLTFTIPSDAPADKVNITIEEPSPPGRKLTIALPVDRYRLKTELCLPLRMPARVMAGHDFTEHHSRERSQSFSYDLAGCDFDGNVFIDGAPKDKNESYLGFGEEVIAPAGGTIVYIRNDVPDNDKPGAIDFGDSYVLDDTTIFGNCIIINHGNHEYSLLGHLQKGSVTVAKGDVVARGDLLGLLGNSGYSSAPHLHYHLMDGPKVFESDGLPPRFTAVLELYTGQRMPHLRVGATVKPVGPTSSRPNDTESKPASAPAEK